MKYTKKFKLKCIKIGNCSIGKAAKKRNIPKQTIAKWIRLYKTNGVKGLENQKPGPKEKPINSSLETSVLNLWNIKKRSSYKMIRDLIKMNHLRFNKVSKRQIDKIYKKYKLIIKR